jgi:hypothetical protein
MQKHYKQDLGRNIGMTAKIEGCGLIAINRRSREE